jgi:hypothetical protein
MRWKLITQRDPRKPALCPRMILGRQRFRIIHASQRHIDRATQVTALIGQGRSTLAAQGANDIRRRRIARRLTLDERESIEIKSRPRDKGRAARPSTSLAVTMRDPIRRPGGAVTNLATKTAAFYEFHDDSLRALAL